MKGHLRFAKVYTAILRDPRITPGAKFFYSLLKTYCNAQGVCFPSIERMCTDSGANEKTVRKWIAELESDPFRIIKRVPRFENGEQITSLCIMQDEHFAKHGALTYKQWSQVAPKTLKLTKKGPPKFCPDGPPKKREAEVEPRKKRAPSKIIPFPRTA